MCLLNGGLVAARILIGVRRNFRILFCASSLINICDLACEKGPYVSNYSQWQTRHVLLHVLGNIDCKQHYTPHQDSFFVFWCYTRSIDSFINVISNTTASAIPLITVFANSLGQVCPFGNQKPATNTRYYDNIVRRNNTSSP